MTRFVRLLLLLPLAVLSLTRPAAASDPMSTYVVPTRVDLEPNDDAATRVYIEGAFFQLTSETAFTYGAPVCGSMYFQCAAGQEAMCRMQWKELRAAITAKPTFCEGFGTLHKVSTATIATQPGRRTPDTWDLGMGVGQGTYVDGKCPMAIALSCPGTPISAAPDGGAAGTGGAAPPDAAAEAPTTPATGAAGTGVPTTPTTGAAGTGAPSATGGGGTGVPPQLAKHDGCALAGGATGSAALAALGLVTMALSRRRRR